MRKKAIDRSKCRGCKNCELACIAVHSAGTTTHTAYATGMKTTERARNKIEADPQNKSFPQFCRHCDEPACVEACTSGALSKGADGLVVCDHDICIGCYMCVMSCPYGMARPSVQADGKMIKCDGCRGRDVMACVAVCPQRCLTAVEVDDPGGGHLIYADEPAPNACGSTP